VRYFRGSLTIKKSYPPDLRVQGDWKQ